MFYCTCESGDSSSCNNREYHRREPTASFTGVDLSAERLCLALAAKRQFVLALTDIRTAFPNARLLQRDRKQTGKVAAGISGTSEQEGLQCSQHGLPKV